MRGKERRTSGRASGCSRREHCTSISVRGRELSFVKRAVLNSSIMEVIIMCRRTVSILLVLVFLVAGTFPVFATTEQAVVDAMEKIPVKVLILPKFEVGDLCGDFPGEAQYYYERYLDGAESYEIPGGTEGSSLYVKDGVALYLLGMGKVGSALSTMAILSDERFDFSQAYILSTGCAGSSAGSSVMGDVFVITEVVDYDLGHHADNREMTDSSSPTWFRDPDFDPAAVIRLNPDLMEKIYALVENLPMETTERTRNYMSAAFDGAEWDVRDPMVLRGTSVTGDNYWKGEYDHINALQMIETYECADPYATAEMEDIGVCTAVKRMGILDYLIILRDSVNMDVFLLGATPESLWSLGEAMSLATEDNVEAADIFATAMKNNYVVGSTIIDAILAGRF